jgi:hypothetical protein
MRLALVAALTAAAALFAASMLGVAVAEAPTVSSLRTVNVEGVATLPIPQNADAATASGTYHQAMAAAVDDGKVKAEVLAGKIAGALGAVQTITEDGGEIECSSGGEEYEPYEGERPDFGSARGSNQVLGASAPSAASAPAVRPLASKRAGAKKHRKRKHPTARKATAPGCKLTAQVSLAYLLG